MLHFSFLAHAEKWGSFFSDLRWVIVDEMHEYRGYFGSNVSLILRRLSHHLRVEHGIQPQFFLCSATCSNARSHAENLTGLQFREIDASDSLRPERKYWFANLDLPDAGYWDELRERTVRAGLACVADGNSVLVFCPTRQFTEECHRMALRMLDESDSPELHEVGADAVRVFRGGLSSKMRQEIQQGMRNGAVRLVFATNALELGINIGGLDGVILAGFPDNMMSARQQIGRAGRSWEAEAFVLYLPRNNPLDRYYAANLDEFLSRPLDALVVNPKNEVLIKRHLACLLYETSDVSGAVDLLGSDFYRAAYAKRAQVVRRGRSRPHFELDIRGGGTGGYTLKVDGDEVGTMSAHQRFREAYEDAIYLHGGTPYRVDSVTTRRGGSGTIRLSEAEPYLRTHPMISAGLSGEAIYNGKRWRGSEGQVEVYFGQVTVTERIHGVEEVDERSRARLRRWQLTDNSAHYWDGEACWIAYESDDSVEMDGILAVAQMLRVGVQLTILADEHDVVTQAEVREGRAYVVESYEGGIGVATQVFEQWQEMLAKGREIADQCECVVGCPRCIVPPRMRDEIDKRAGMALAAKILGMCGGDHDDRYEGGLWEPR